MANVAGALWTRGGDQPGRIALRGPGGDWTYGMLRERIGALAGGLRDRGISPGDRVVLIAPSVPEFGAAYYGLQAAGAAVVAVNPMATSYEIEYALADAGCSLVIAWHDSAGAAVVAAASFGSELWELQPGLAELPAEGSIEAPAERGGDETAAILYTSGTTGRPKGAQLTHDNLLACATITAALVELSPDDSFCTALPLFHVFGGSVIMGTALAHGAALSLLPTFDARTTVETIVRDGPTIFAGVPTMYNAMLDEAGEGVDLSCLRLCLSGGASLPDEVLREFDRRFGAVVLEGYGLTETTGVGTFNGLHGAQKAGSVGAAAPSTEVRTVGDDGSALGVDEVGEVTVRGPTVMKGYCGRPEETAEAIRDGWLLTGDLGAFDADGDLRIVGRKKDLITHGGYNVYPREV
ncbi:MAG TPA: AMP-binding protein, partial [Solirubrobacterales bacterium]